MIPPVTIGRYEFRITDVLACVRRTGWRGWLQPGYDVLLAGGIKVSLNEEEKTELDDAIETHNTVMSVYGFTKTLGFRG